jgi:uncharacterized glyoxalase superfamily protein PhnB
MKGKIALITILTDDVHTMTMFYKNVLGFEPQSDLGEYTEYHSEGVRFAICARSIMEKATHHPSYREAPKGQPFELAFPLDTPDTVDETYDEIVAKGATPVQPPATMPWGQRTAFFADPDGNIHELFADLPVSPDS